MFMAVEGFAERLAGSETELFNKVELVWLWLQVLFFGRDGVTAHFAPSRGAVVTQTKTSLSRRENRSFQTVISKITGLGL